MKSHRMILLTETKRGVRSRIWNTTEPLAVGHPAQFWIVKKDQRFQLHTKSGEEVADFGMQQARQGFRPAYAPDLKLKVLSVNPPPAAFRDHRGQSTTSGLFPMVGRQLFVYSSVAQWMQKADAVSSAYVGYRKSIPVFTLTETRGTYTLRCLVPRVRLKTRRQPIKKGDLGVAWNLRDRDLCNSIIQLGSYSWRFNYVNESTVDGSQMFKDEVTSDDPESSLFKGSLIASILMLLALMSISWVYHAKMMHMEEEAAPPSAHILLENTRFVPQKVDHLPRVVPKVNKIEPQQTQEVKMAIPPIDVTKPLAPAPPPAPTTRQKPTRFEPPKPKPKHNRASAQPLKSTSTQTASDPAAQKAAIEDAIKGLLRPTDTQPSVNTGSHQPNPIFNGDPADPAKNTVHRTGKPGISLDVAPITDAAVQADYDKNTRNLGTDSNQKMLSMNWVQSKGESISVDGGLTKDQVARVIASHIDEVRYCHNLSTSHGNLVDGKINLSFVIAPNGSVATAAVQSSDVQDGALGPCILQRLKRWSFPTPRGGVSVAVDYPFVFQTIHSGGGP